MNEECGPFLRPPCCQADHRKQSYRPKWNVIQTASMLWFHSSSSTRGLMAYGPEWWLAFWYKVWLEWFEQKLSQTVMQMQGKSRLVIIWASLCHLLFFPTTTYMLVYILIIMTAQQHRLPTFQQLGRLFKPQSRCIISPHSPHQFPPTIKRTVLITKWRRCDMCQQ